VQNRRNSDIRRRTLGIVMAGAVLIVAIVIYGASVLNQIRGVETHWKTFSTVTIARDAQLHRIQQQLGYGGFIHNFKNFILRDDLRDLDKARDNLVQIRDAIDILRREHLSSEEADALNVVITTVKAYEVRLTMADEAFIDGFSSNEVDSLVIVDDRAALAALKVLSHASSMRVEEVQHATEQQLSSTIRFAALGLLVVPLIILIGYILYRSTRSLTRAHVEIRAVSEQLEGLLDTSPEAMIVANSNGEIMRANHAVTHMLEYESGELIGKPLEVLMPETNREQHHTRFGVFMEKPKPGVLSIEGELKALTKSGREIPIEISLSAMEQGQDVLITATIRDITLRKAYERALVDTREKAVAANQAKSDFLANMSHEIRTPINAVIGLSALALKTDMNAKQLDYTRKIYSSGRRLLEVVNDVLDFSKIEAGKLDVVRSHFLLSSVIRDVSAVMAVRAREKNVELIFRIPADMPDALIGDPLRLGQVLSNLVSNAVKFTSKGTVVVEARVKTDDKTGNQLSFSVTDTGVGIPPDDLTKLFEAFSQADTSATRQFGGTGLGLTICKSILDSMGGEISVTSTPGVGSRFVFTVPLEEEPDANIGTRPISRAEARNTRLLIVDDNETACEMMEKELSALGFPIDTALSGSAAIQSLEQATVSGNPYRLMFLDWQMPEVGGLETMRRIAANPNIDPVSTILAVAPFNVENVKRQTADLSVDAFVDKPLNTSLLIDAIVNVLNGHPEWATSQEVLPGQRGSVLADSAKGRRVLVVEDNFINQQVAREILENEGLFVDTADNGRIALDMLFKQGPEIYSAILMDIQMPEMDGVTATKEIRNDPSFDGVPIIALTAHALSEDRQRCIDAGMNGHLTKPVIADDLVSALNTWISGEIPVEFSEEAVAETLSATVTQEAVATVTEPEAIGDSAEDNEAASDSENTPILDLEKASSVSRLSEGFLQELLWDFRDQYTEAAETIRGHLDSGERAAAQTIAHTIKGTSGSLGAEQVFAAAIQLDADLKASAPDEVIDKSYTEFAEALSRLLTYVEDTIPRSEG